MEGYKDSGLQGPSNGLVQDATSSSSSSIPPPSEVTPPTTSGPSVSNSNSTSQQGGAPRIRRRNRMITSCLECRRRKLKCNKSHPCTNCTKFKRDCLFLAPALDQASQLKLTEIKEKVGSLERLLERDVARKANGVRGGEREREREDGEGGVEEEDEEGFLEPTPLAVIDAAYENDGHDDDLLDLGIQLGKMRLTERIGGFFRPKISQELEFTVTKDNEKEPSLSPPAQTLTLPPASEWLKPGPSYIVPSSNFFFGNPLQTTSVIDFLPSRLAADRLMKQYFTCVHPICQLVHRPTFERQYDVFWDEISLGIEPAGSVQAIVFAAMFSAVVSMDEAIITRDFGQVSKAKLQDNFKLGTETALARANFLRTTKIEVLQAFLMYMIPLCRAELSRAHSVLVGGAIRMAECMGLHRDGETYGMNPLETHIRRLVWYQLAFLDIRTCEAQGPRPSIRRDDFDTKYPLNIADDDLHPSGPPPINADRFSDSTISLIRFEINEMMRTIWVDRPKIERKKLSLTAVLGKIETFRADMMKYDRFLDERIPVQRLAKIVKALLIARLHIMVLHRYHNSVATPMPDRLRSILIAAGVTLLEAAVALETIPELHPWSWYAGAFQQYHTAFLLLMEVHVYPHRKEADRIWACLDYIFECPPNETRRIKAMNILSELQQKTAIYQSMRGMRAPLDMNKHTAHISSKNSPPSSANTPPPFSSPLEAPLTAPIAYGAPGIQGVPGPAVGRVPLVGRDVQFAGVADGEALWASALPREGSVGSSSEAGSVKGGAGAGGMGVVMPGGNGGSGGDDLMADIDWDAFDALFPPDQALDMPQFTFSAPATFF